MLTDPCADPRFLPGWSGPDCQKTALLSSTFTVLQWLINGLFQRKLLFYKVWGVGGSNLFQGGGGAGCPNANSRNPYNF